MLTKKTVLLAKIESPYGSDAAPAAADNAVVAYVDDNPITIIGEVKERNFGNDDLSPYPELIGKKMAELKFTTEIKGSGAAGTAPRWGPLARACGLEESIVSATSVTYTPRSSSFEGCTIYLYVDGIRHDVIGCIGDYEIDLTAGEKGLINWTFRGLYELPTDQVIVAPTFDTTTPVIVKGTTTTFGSYAAIIEKLVLKANNVVAERPDFNQTHGVKGFAISSRNYVGNIILEAVLRAETNADFFSYFDARTLKALSLALGAVAGNITTLTAPYCYLRAPKWGNREGIRTFELEFQAARSSGDDEMALALT